MSVALFYIIIVCMNNDNEFVWQSKNASLIAMISAKGRRGPGNYFLALAKRLVFFFCRHQQHEKLKNEMKNKITDWEMEIIPQ